jgi:hypothetical protein
MSFMKILTHKWPQILVVLGIISIAGGAAWIAVSSLVQEPAPLAPLLLLALGMMPFLVGLEELASRRKVQRLSFNRR